MFHRTIQSELQNWAKKGTRKPLVIRGARQVGKTTAISQFASSFDQYLYLNLELPEDRQPFEDFTNMERLLQNIFFIRNEIRSKGSKSLIFIDEIQEFPRAMQILRYFFEQAPEIYVIAAGSMLESLFNPDISFPVGRVEYLVIHPASFPEYLDAMEENSALDLIHEIPVPDFAHQKLLSLFHTYCLIGGMPEVVSHYATNKDLVALNSIFESLIISYLDDVEKYANNDAQTQVIRHAIRSSYAEAGKRIKFQGFGKSNYGSREIGEALRTLEKALLIHLIYPQTSPTLPIQPNYRRSPRLQVLDTGMLNYFVGIQNQIIGTEKLDKVYQGRVIEHITGQEILASQFSALHGLHFWVRDKKGSSAEVDYLYPYKGLLIPVEVKSGATGKLKSLHMFMDLVPHDMAVRVNSGPFSLSGVRTPENKKYKLLNLPYYLISQLEPYLKWFEKQL